MDASSLIPLFKVVLIFGTMLAGIKFGLGIGLSILSGSLATAFFFKIHPLDLTVIAFQAVFDFQFIILAMIVILIMLLSRIMENSGQSQKLMSELAGLLTWPKFKLAFFPALIGLLPMPGGAVFSAPMVKAVAQDQNLSSQDKILINYWFRHVWELVWPLYPGIILAAYLSGIPLVKLLGYTWPGLVICLLVGWIFYLAPLRLNSGQGQMDKPDFNAGKAFYQGMPLIMAIAGSLSLEGVVWSLTSFDPEIGLVAGLVLSIAICMAQNKMSLFQSLGYLREKHLWQMVFVILVIFIFKNVLDHGGVVKEISGSISGPGALLAAAALLPMLVGMISGITIAFVGSTFPLFLGVAEQLGIQSNIPYVILGLFSGLAGVMVSPIHICFVLTCEFFHTNITKVWPRLFRPCALLFVSGLGYFFLLKAWT
ncbi:DUF401 family protein [Desulfonatronovibrio hydrogenovorans]|uniref:DUF401 family protein n=1 Tax=Desulfonatronovibrio hydrogenovorans TaxID=53245 RepID=UPI00048AEAC6|nr:DUF401 family protein [Desulfonatronovibrio hydrogenovorans]